MRAKRVYNVGKLLLVRQAHGPGFINYRCEGRRYQISRSGISYEVAIWNNDDRSWLLCSGETPDGVFKSQREAAEALAQYLTDNPPPLQMVLGVTQ